MAVAGENFENFGVLFEFGALFQQSGIGQWFELNFKMFRKLQVWPMAIMGSILI